MKIEIDALPDEMLQKLTGHGLTAPNACFQNCFSTTVVFGDAVSGGMHYVLCWLVDKFQTRHPHALVAYGGKFFDITLQANPKAHGYVMAYFLERSLSRDQAIEIFLNSGGRIELASGRAEIEGIPPALFPDGCIRCDVATSFRNTA